MGLGWRTIFTLERRWFVNKLSSWFDNFDNLLKGANEMDEHFKTADFEENIPVVLALLAFGTTTFSEPKAKH